MNQLLMFWLIPAALLMVIGFMLNFYRIHFGSEKDLPRDQKISSYWPSPWCVIFALLPLANIVMVMSICILLTDKKERDFIL